MSKNLLSVALIAVAVNCGLSLPVHAQNTSPYWSLAGNSNSTASSKLGTTNAIPLRLFTGNKLRVYIGTTGTVNIGNGTALTNGYQLYVKGGTGGVLGTGTSYGVFGEGGRTGYGISAHSVNSYGGLVTSDSSDGLDVYSSHGYFGVYASCQNVSGYGSFGYSPYIGVYGSGGSYGTYGYSYSGQAVRAESYIGIGGYFHSSGSWALEATSDSGYYAGVFFGHVYASQGFITSDRRLKKNIEDFKDAMSIINRLQPKYYEFKTDAQYAALHLPKGAHYGLIAQDLEQVLPNLVHEEKFKVPIHTEPVLLKPKSPDGKDENQYQQPATIPKTESVDVKAVNYEELIPIMIKALQEQQEQINELKQTIANMQGNSVTSAQSTSLNSLALMQNVPNPYENATTIQYNLPAKFSIAKIIITDNSGKTIKQINVSGAGKGSINLDASSLAAGTYNYSLLIDGKVVDKKQMVVTK